MLSQTFPKLDRSERTNMWILISAIVTASFMGSLHCVGMCGPLAIWASGADRSRSGTLNALPVSLYHIGRLLTYTIAGGLAGVAGQLLDLGGNILGIQLFAARLVGSLMVVIGTIALYRTIWPVLKLKLRHLRGTSTSAEAMASSSGSYTPPRPTWLNAQLIRLRPYLFSLPMPARGLVVGLLTALLPCGWLYLFALLAAGTGNAISGAVVMIAFWLGSVPALVAVVAGAQLLASPLRHTVPIVASMLLVLAGMHTVSGRGFAELGKRLSISGAPTQQWLSGHSLESMDAGKVNAAVETLVATPLPCCQPGLDRDGPMPIKSTEPANDEVDRP